MNWSAARERADETTGPASIPGRAGCPSRGMMAPPRAASAASYQGRTDAVWPRSSSDDAEVPPHLDCDCLYRDTAARGEPHRHAGASLQPVGVRQPRAPRDDLLAALPRAPAVHLL